MQKDINFDAFNYDDSIEALAAYCSPEKEKIVLRGNSIQLIQAEEQSENRPISDLQIALISVIEEANNRFKSGLLPDSTQIHLREGISLLGRHLHNENIAKLSQRILIKSSSEETAERLPNSYFNISRVISSAKIGFKALGNQFRWKSLLGQDFPLMDLPSDIRRFHIFRHLEAKDFLSLTETSTTLRDEVLGDLNSTNDLLIARAFKEFGSNPNILYKVSKLQAMMGYTESAQNTRSLASEKLDQTLQGEVFISQLISLAQTKIDNDDIEGAQKSIQIAINATNNMSASVQKLRLLLDIFEIELALKNLDNAKNTLLTAKSMVISLGTIEDLKTVAEALISIQEFEGVRNILRAAKDKTKSYSQSVSFLLKIMKLQFSIKDDKEANKTLEKAIAIACDMESDPVWHLLDIAKELTDNLNDRENLLKLFEIIKQTFEKSSSSMTTRAENFLEFALLLAKAGETADAERFLAIGKAKLSDIYIYRNEEEWCLVGIVYSELNQPEKMIEAFSLAIESAYLEDSLSSKVQLLQHIASNCDKVGEKQTAINILNETRKLIINTAERTDWTRQELKDLSEIQIAIRDITGAKESLAIASAIPVTDIEIEKNAQTTRIIIELQLALKDIKWAELSVGFIQDEEDRIKALLDIALAKTKLQKVVPG